MKQSGDAECVIETGFRSQPGDPAKMAGHDYLGRSGPRAEAPSAGFQCFPEHQGGLDRTARVLGGAKGHRH